jgi:uncharacterized OB-fold protein
MDYLKPLPAVDNWSRPFWQAARDGQLKIQACTGCGHLFFPPGPVCPKCLGDALEWRPVSGRGTVESWVVFHQAYYKGFADELPYNVAMVRLEEGPFLFTNLVGIDNAAIRRGLPVEAVFEKATDDVTIPRFRAAGGGA